MNREDRVTLQLRQLLLLLGALTCAGVLAELLITGHYESWQQWLPLVLCGAGALLFGAAALRAQAPPAMLTILALLLLAGGAAGVFFHLTGNLEFAREVRAAEAAASPVVAAFSGGNPPLAPGALGVAGLMGLAAGYGRR